MQAVIELSGELSMAQDTAIPQQVLNELSNHLVKCLTMEAFPDIMGILIYIYCF